MSGLLQKTRDFMLGYDSSYEEYEDYYDDEEMEEFEEAKPLKRQQTSQRTRSTINESKPTKVVELPNNQKSFVLICAPKNTNESVVIIDSVRDNKTCIVNLEGVDKDEAQRIADFLSGALYALNGEIQRVSNDIFITAPAGVDVSGTIEETIKSNTASLPWLSRF